MFRPHPTSTLGLKSYLDSFDHLMAELVWINHLVSEHVVAMRQAKTYRKFENFSGLYISDDEIDTIINTPAFLDPSSFLKQDGCDSAEDVASEMLRSALDEKIRYTVEAGIALPLYEIRQRFGLSAFEYQAFLLCLVCEVDARYEKLYAYLQNDLTRKSPGVHLIMDLLGLNAKARLQHLNVFHPESPLRQSGLLVCTASSEEDSIVLQHFRAPQRLAGYVLKNGRAEQRLIAYMRYFSGLDWERVVIAPSLQARLQALFQAMAETGETEGPQPILFLHGPQGIGKKTIARALVHGTDRQLGVADLRLLVKNPGHFREHIRLVMREGILQPCVVCFEHFEALQAKHETDPALTGTLIQEISSSGWPTILCSEEPLPIELLSQAVFYAVEIPFPDFLAQRALWNVHLQGLDVDGEAPVDFLTVRYSLRGGQIANAVRFAQQEAGAGDSQEAVLSPTALSKGARLSAQPRLSALARRIHPSYRWDDLVLPLDQLQQLKELAGQVKYKQQVMGAWGFAGKLPLGKGLNALFAGPSGTGKTMAAEVIANDLDLDLYKINLATVVSKYIGETEKNLNRLFDEAEHSNAILFFDEADALFGKRSEVKDAHDRYSNIEIAFLLQRMEEYEGISMLATNLRQNIDEAFTRRLRFMIDFPFPSEVYRERIWQKIWPSHMPVEEDVDLTFMARQFEITGGNIRNIALAAAFYAADNGGVVRMEHVLKGTRRELQKMGKLCIKEDFGVYQHLV